MAYIEEPMSELEKIIGRRMPITFSVVIALCVALYLKNEQMTSALVVLLTAIITTLFRDIGTEKANNAVIRQEVAEASINGKE